MQPTQQTLIPVTIYNGEPSSGITDIPLNVNYDHVLTCIVANNVYSTTDDYLEIDDQSGNYLWSETVTGIAIPPGPTITWNGFLVCQSQTLLQLQSALGACNISISAYRLNPSATLIFS